MPHRFILTFAAAAFLASTALVAPPAFAGKQGIGKHTVSHSKSIRHAGRHGSRHVHSNNHKSGKLVVAQAKKGSGIAQLSKGTGKLGNGPGRLANGPGKNLQMASNNTNTLRAGPGRAYGDMMGPTTNTTPTQDSQGNANSNAPKSGGPTDKTTSTQSNSPKSTSPKYQTPFSKVTNWLLGKGIDKGIEKAIPVYGPVKTVYDVTTTVGPKVKATYDRSMAEQEQADLDKAAAIEAIEKNREQGGGFLGQGLNSIDMDP